MGTKNTTLLVVVIILIVGAIVYLNGQSSRQPDIAAVSIQPVLPEPSTETTVASAPASEAGVPQTANNAAESVVRRAAKAREYPLAKEIVNPTGFINTLGNKPVTIQSLIGKKVILLDIWTYSCINCQRTLPYLKAWYEKYKDQGLEIIGLHVPEFEFEKDYANVSEAVKKFNVTWPVVLDNNSATARSYGMRYWPEEYLIDIDGYIVHKSVGEGRYDEKEAKIQELLNERMKVLGQSGKVSVPITPIDMSAVPQAASPETYFGSARNGNLGNGVVGSSGEKQFVLPSDFQINTLYLGGNWNSTPEYAETTAAGAEIVFKYKARNVYFVAHAVNAVSVTVLRDGKPLGAERGADVSSVGGESRANIAESRLYKLIENDDGGEHTIRLMIGKPGLQAYTFTFG